MTRFPSLRPFGYVVAVLLVLAGAGFVLYPAATDQVQARAQSSLAAELEEVLPIVPAPAPAPAPGTAAPAPASRVEPAGAAVTASGALARIVFPRIGLDEVVVEGTSDAMLRKGIGHYAGTAMPGERGNASFAGHRTTYGSPFRRLDEVVKGDKVTLTSSAGTFTYVVTADPFVVDDTDWSVVEPTEGATLTLTTCHPVGSARQRLVVKAVLARVQ